MARTSECGEPEAGSSGARANGHDTTPIKKEALIDAEQSSNAPLSLGGKDWPFFPACSSASGSNEASQPAFVFGSNITDPADKEKMEKLLENATSLESKRIVSDILSDIDKLSDVERLLLYFKLPLGRSSDLDPLRIPLNPLGSRPEIMQTVIWIQTHLKEDVEISLPKHEVYEEYVGYCTENGIKPLSTADFGKVMKQVFPNVRPRRLGTRGHSRYCYSGLTKKEELDPPMLSDLNCDGKPGKADDSYSPPAHQQTDSLAHDLIRDWAEKLLGTGFADLSQLADFLVEKQYADQRNKNTVEWSKLRSVSAHQSEDELGIGDTKGVVDHDSMRELKRKLQEQHNLVTHRRQSTSGSNRQSKKTKVSGSAAGSPLPTSLPGPVAQHQLEEKKPESGGDKKASRCKKKPKSEEAARGKTSAPFEASDVEPPKMSAGKIAIPRLSRGSPARLPNLALLPAQNSQSGQSPSPTSAVVGKPKFIPIQPKPSGETAQNGFMVGTLTMPQLKEEDPIQSRLPSDLLEGQWSEGACHDDELANYWTSQHSGESFTDSLSPKPSQSQTELSQLRVLLEQNEAKKRQAGSAPTVGLFERRNVRFETPSALSSDPNGAAGGGSGGNGGVPPSPNTRRRAFNFTPISPRLTPDVPPSPGTNCSGTGQLRQLLSTSSGVASPFISPRQTPIPSCSSLPPSQPHSRHNSGHLMSMDTPTSIVTCESNSNDSAFVSPLNTPLSVNRSRHNSAANSSTNNGNGHGNHNMFVNRVRHSSGASVAIRHTPYPTGMSMLSMVNHAPQEGPSSAVLSSVRSRHSSAGSPSLPRSAPLSPLVQSFPQQEPSFACDRLRQDLRRRHVSAGVVLGMNRHQGQAAASSRVHPQQTTLNSAVPVWGNDPLAQEIEGLLDSASSGVNDSVLNRSQSVPIHQMLQQLQNQTGGQGQNYASLSQPNTPYGMGKPFNFSSAASSPYTSYTATPVPAEWNDFSSHAHADSGAEGFGLMDTAGNLENFHEIISEVYANNQQELAPCLDGLGVEALQNANSAAAAAFPHMNFHGSNSALANMDSDPSLSCSDTGDGYPLNDLNDSVNMPVLMGPDDLAATLVALKEAP